MNFIQLGLKILPHAFNIGSFIADLIRSRKKEKYREEERRVRRDRINEALEGEIRKLNEQKAFIAQKNREYQQKLADLENLLQSNKEQMENAKREKMERERQWMQKEQEEQERKMKQIEEEKLAIQKCKESLENEFTEGILEIINHFSSEEEKWLYSFHGPEIDERIKILKEELNTLFDKLFKNEQVMKKINQKFLNIVKKTFKPQELEKMNIMIIGKSGVGKSTLINELFGEHLAEEGTGTRVTIKTKKYVSKLVPFLSLYDTMGIEIGSGHKLNDVFKETLEEIMYKLDSNDPNEHIHCILYCTTSNRVFKDELEVILKLREKYDGKKLPIIIVYTRAVGDSDAEGVKNAINEFLKEHEESLSDDIFGITFTKVNAREDSINTFNGKMLQPCFGLSHLMKLCYQKGEQSYRFAIKNSLIQIGQKSIQEYLDNISNQIATNEDFCNYLKVNLEPNFLDYISYCFEKITDINDQRGIEQKEIDKLLNYIVSHPVKQESNMPVIYCMVCDSIPKNYYKCKACESEVCENCYYDYFACKNCDKEDFERVDDNCNSNEIKYNPKDNIQEDNKYDENDHNQINENKNLSNYICMICYNQLSAPYKCKNCAYKVCEECYLKKLQEGDDEYYYCENCGEKDFEKEEKDKPKNIIKFENDNKSEHELNEKYKEQENNGIHLGDYYINDDEQYKNYLKNIKETEGKKLSKKLCMICNNIPTDPLKCSKCGYKICQLCQVKMHQEQDLYNCEKCENNVFDPATNDLENEEEEISNDDEINEGNSLEILSNKLSMESIDAIKQYIKIFKNELLEEFNGKFQEFANKAADDIYLKVAEKYINMNENQQMKMDKMKSKKELRSEAIEEINNSLKPKVQENFLSRFASKFHKDIVEIFKRKCEKKLEEFINDLLNNKQANELFQEFDAFNENKKLKFEGEFKKYINILDKKESESYDKAINNGSSSSDMGETVPNEGDSNMGETGSSGCGNSSSQFQG